MRNPTVGYAAELCALHPVIPEGTGALAPLFCELISGLEHMHGPVGLSLALGPAEHESERDEFDDPGTRRLAFCLRVWATTPIPISLRARAEAVLLARRSEPDEWTIAQHISDLRNVSSAIADFELGQALASARAGTAAITLALPGPRPPQTAAPVRSRPMMGRLPKDGPIVGRVARTNGSTAPWRLSWGTRRHHVLIAASSGFGKTTVLEHIALEDIEQGRSLVVVDPHGDLVREIAPFVPEDRRVLIDPRLNESGPLDLLDQDPARAAAHLYGAIAEIWPSEFAGPVWQRMMSLTTQALAASRALGRSMALADVERFLTDVPWRASVIDGIDDDQHLKAELAAQHAMWQREPRDSDTNAVSWASAKLTPLTQGPGAHLFNRAPGKPLETQLRSGCVILVALPIGTFGAATTRLAARMFMTRLMSAIAAQGELQEEARHPVSVLLDEAHLLVGPALRGLLSQSRKFNACITVSCQSLAALEPALEELLTSTQTLLFGRLSHRDAARVADRIGGTAVRALPTLPRHHLLLITEDTDPGQDPFVLSPVPPPTLHPAPPSTGSITPETSGDDSTDDTAADRPPEPRPTLSSAPVASFETVLDELFSAWMNEP